MTERQANALASAILETVRLPLLALDADLRVETVNDAFLHQFRVTREETAGRLIYDLGNGQWDLPELRRLLGEVLPERTTVSDYRVEHDFEQIGRRIMHLSARKIARDGEPDLILLAISDDTEREALRAELVGRVELADKLIDSVREGLLILDPDLRVRSASGSFYETFAVEPAQTVGHLVYELGNGQWNIPELRKLLEEILPRQQSFDDYEVSHVFEDIGERIMVLNGRRLDHMDLILLAVRDVTESRENAARLRDVASAGNIGVFESDLRNGTLFWSPELREIVGWPQDRPPPRDSVVPDFVHPDDRATVAETFAKVTDPRGDGVIYLEHRIVRPNGQVRWVQMQGRAEFGGVAGERRPVRLRGVLLDVTERKRAEERLRERERRLSEVLDGMGEAFGLIDREMRIVVQNDAALRLDGRPLEEIHGRSHWDVYPGSEDSELGRLYKRALAERVPVSLEHRYQFQDGTTRWLAMRAYPVPEGLAVFWRDITERKEAEAALRVSEERYRTLVAEMDEGVMIFERLPLRSDGLRDWRYVAMNPVSQSMFGTGDLTGQSVRDNFPEEDEGWYDVYDRALETGRVERFERATSSQGVVLSMFVARVDPGPPGRIMVVMQDITARRRAEEALRANQERQSFLLDLSDHIRGQPTADAVAAEGLRLVCRQLSLDRAFVARIHGPDQPIRIAAECGSPGLPPMPAELRPADFPEGFRRAAEGLMVVPDIRSAEGLTDLDRRSLDGLALTGLIVAPLHRGAEGLIWALVGGCRSPRRWTEAEVTVVAESAERIWAGMERSRAEQAQRESEARYRQLFDSIDQGFCVIEMIFDDGGSPVDYRFLDVNDAFQRQTGLEDAVGKTMRSLEPEHEHYWFEIYGRIAVTREPERFENAAEALGRHYEVYAFPFGEATERKVGVLFNDISDRKRGEEHRNMLMAELDHRVKNILAVVQSIARQSLRRGQEASPDAAGRLIGRIDALAQSHKLLASSHWEGARFGDLVESAVGPYRGERAERICAEGSDLKVSPKAAQTLTLALHELVTNSAKYGSLSREGGTVRAHWQISGEGDDRRLVFEWQEHGGPPIETPPDRKGFGSRLIETTLSYELGGAVTMDFARDGLRAVIDLPLGRLRARSERRDRSRRRSERPTARDPATLNGKAVLVVEDEYLVGRETADALRSAGCSVTGPVATLPEALRIAVSEEFDAAVLDINLNGELVWPAARALQARGIPLVFMTGYADTIRTPPELEDAERIEKPVEPGGVVTTLANAVARSTVG